MAKIVSMRNGMRVCNALMSLSISFCALAQDTKAAPCSAPEHRQFDFWIGDWEVKGPAGKVAGQNTITSTHSGCVVLESWKGAGGVTGSSFNVYDPERRKWRQTWVDSTGGILDLEGEFADGKMVLASAPGASTKRGADAINRITWQPLPDGRVRQHWEVSPDRGATWKSAFDGYYTKR
jgi:hypothetical protein